MATITYKCPNCDGPLLFDPESQRFECEYCMSSFNEMDLKKAEPAREAEKVQNKEDNQNEGNQKKDSKNEGSQNKEEQKDTLAVYTCPSCGAEIVADETTAATFCYYCHNPVVLSSRLEGKFRPDKVIPFAIAKEDAVKQFLEWTGKKKFIPKAFFSKKQIEKITGLYVPYWIADCDLDARMSAKATKVRTWRSGDIEYTETEYYQLEREGHVRYDGVPKKALDKDIEVWVENVEPFRLEEARNFTPGYLLGFQAEKRNIEKEAVQSEIEREAKQGANKEMRDSMSGYFSVTRTSSDEKIHSMKWKYILLPVWILTYKSITGKVYYYAMNGQTGEMSGELPVDKKKLAILSACITAVTTLIMLI